jgi:hypothetical protein
MNKNLIIAKFIEKNGLKIVFILSILIAFLVGLIFYFREDNPCDFYEYHGAQHQNKP